MAVHFTHLALVVMVMDLCFNQDEADEAKIKAEVKAALQMFEDSRKASPLLGRFLSSLSDVLRKHKVHLSNPSTLATNEIMLDAFNNPSDDDQMQSTQIGMEMQDPGVPLDTFFDDFWQIAMGGEPNPDSLIWDNLFSALDSRPL